ncbi:unnamed protein product [Lepeophtheirus salmonis]|uniref:(salmon louse) hypothetical protein n=1 Tax=Lepeophtheirus salmonis TaxID=72036 RepID=A0A7R8HDS8_LEPSM|nr:unnamed protein product [Lepeophtheirus salmonis]CAF3028975.1 unnamed protein product [Lepeophtheirus salmonis]
MDELSSALPLNRAGKDSFGYTGSDVRNLDQNVMLKHLNSVLANGKIDKMLLEARTTFISKKESPKTASDYRPICVLPHIVQTLHRIIDSRLQKLPISEEHVGFRKMDGCSINHQILVGLIKRSKEQSKPISLAWLDMRKAFDSRRLDNTTTELSSDSTVSSRCVDITTDTSVSVTYSPAAPQGHRGDRPRDFSGAQSLS